MLKCPIDELRMVCVVGLERLTLFWKNRRGLQGAGDDFRGVGEDKFGGGNFRGGGERGGKPTTVSPQRRKKV